MPTPLFKVLANALRLGQPPDPALAIRALVDVIQHQESEMNELRQRLSLVSSRLQFLEAKTSRMEAVSFHGTPPSVPPPPSAPPPPPGPGLDIARLSMPNPLPKAEPLPRLETLLGSMLDEDSMGGEASGTLVVSRADIDAVVRQEVEHEAPYPLAPPGGHRKASDGRSQNMPFKPPVPRSTDGDITSRKDGQPQGPLGSDPYLPIEEPSDDTFASTAEGAPVNLGDVRLPSRHPHLDEASFDDQVLTSILKRTPRERP